MGGKRNTGSSNSKVARGSQAGRDKPAQRRDIAKQFERARKVDKSNYNNSKTTYYDNLEAKTAAEEKARVKAMHRARAAAGEAFVHEDHLDEDGVLDLGEVDEEEVKKAELKARIQAMRVTTASAPAATSTPYVPTLLT